MKPFTFMASVQKNIGGVLQSMLNRQSRNCCKKAKLNTFKFLLKYV
jgi:hypothetical protein